mmetsp:Transcript_16175/g.39118  ORF Transcript_16175/g.39118 Transcript_16175/m.39118 type:complete len:458 (-) Transcript_16175:142-1515(-)
MDNPVQIPKTLPEKSSGDIHHQHPSPNSSNQSQHVGERPLNVARSRWESSSENAAKLLVPVDCDVVEQERAVELKWLSRRQLGLLRKPPLSKDVAHLLHQATIRGRRIHTQRLAQRGRHGTTRGLVHATSVSGTIVVCTSAEELDICRAEMGVRLLLPPSVRPLEWKVQPCPTVTAVHHRGQSGPIRKWMHNDLADLVVCNHTSLFEIHRQDGLIHPIFFHTLRILLLRAVTAEMEEQDISRLGAGCQPLQSSTDIHPSRTQITVRLVVGKNLQVRGVPPVGLRQQALHVVDIRDAAAQLPSLSKIVDANEHSTLAASQLGRSANRLRLGAFASTAIHVVSDTVLAAPGPLPLGLGRLACPAINILRDSVGTQPLLRGWRLYIRHFGLIHSRALWTARLEQRSRGRASGIPDLELVPAPSARQGDGLALLLLPLRLRRRCGTVLSLRWRRLRLSAGQ